MQKPKQGIKILRFLLPEYGQGQYREILKLKLAITKRDFYVFGQNLKISFHDSGKKVLYIKNTNERIYMFQDEKYDAVGINPIFSYFPSCIESYPLVKTTQNRCADIVLNEISDRTNFAIKLFWINPSFFDNETGEGSVEIPKEDVNIAKAMLTGTRPDGKKDTFLVTNKHFIFGNQVFYFDIEPINLHGIDKKYKHMVIYKPGITISMGKYFKETVFGINADELKKRDIVLQKPTTVMRTFYLFKHSISFTHQALNLNADKNLVYTAMSKHLFYYRMFVSRFVIEEGGVPLNQFMIFDYFLKNQT